MDPQLPPPAPSEIGVVLHANVETKRTEEEFVLKSKHKATDPIKHGIALLSKHWKPLVRTGRCFFLFFFHDVVVFVLRDLKIILSTIPISFPLSRQQNHLSV